MPTMRNTYTVRLDSRVVDADDDAQLAGESRSALVEDLLRTWLERPTRRRTTDVAKRARERRAYAQRGSSLTIFAAEAP